MTTPLEERNAALIAEPTDRTERIKWLWREAVDHLPTDAYAKIMEAPDCDVLIVGDERLGDILYQKITYGAHSVIECSGVVVCRLA